MSNISAGRLAESFKNAIVIEQRSDLLATEEYLATYSPRKLANFGLAIINLVISNLKNGLGGKTLIELSLDPAVSNVDDDINPGTIRVGDIIKLSRMSAKVKATDEEDSIDLEAVVTKVGNKMVVVAVDEDNSDEKVINLYNNTGNDNTRVCIVKLANSVTYKRMVSSMNKLSEIGENKINTGISSKIVDALLGKLPNSLSSSKKKISFFDPNLNESQQQAIKFAINESPITIIHGPPGTGKTYTLIELIKQLSFNHNERVLVCGPSNISVDTILERLSPVFTEEASTSNNSKKKKAAKVGSNVDKLIRIGHPARLLQSNLVHSLDVLSKTNYSGGITSDSKEVLKDIQKDIQDILVKVKKCKRYSERRTLWSELKTLKKELREREKKVTEELLVGAKVILLTLHGAGSYELTSLYKSNDPSINFNSSDNALFDTIIIDEVSQSLEPQCWIPIVNHLGFKRLIIAGDNMQLPPTVKSKDELSLAIKKLKLEPGADGDDKVADLECTLFDRLVNELDGSNYKKLLDTQYRMNTDIMKFPSDELYESKLKAHESVANITLKDLPDVSTIDETETKCLWYDTQGGDYPEKSTEDDEIVSVGGGGSKYNELEALLCIQHLQALLHAGVKPGDIGIISPYNAQVSLLKKTLHEKELNGVEISTVDGFQGREKEAIVVSLVRSNDNREVGFLKDKRRLNVAITRPKRHLCIIGDLELMEQCGVEFLKNWGNLLNRHLKLGILS